MRNHTYKIDQADKGAILSPDICWHANRPSRDNSEEKYYLHVCFMLDNFFDPG